MKQKPKRKQIQKRAIVPLATGDYTGLLGGIGELLEAARRASARAVNAFMTATYWEVGRRIVEFEQGGAKRAGYGEELLERLSQDLTKQYGRGFARPNLIRFRQFYQAFPSAWIRSTVSNELAVPEICPTPSGISETPSRILKAPAETRFSLDDLAKAFPLPWSHYVLLVRRSRSPEALAFYQTEALRGGWSVRQLRRQMDSQFYERTALSRNKAAMLKKGGTALPADAVTPEEELKDPLILEFLGLKDEYSESDLEEALTQRLEDFLMELGGEFAFIGRQRRLRIDDEWYRVDLLFFHRRLRCLVIIDLKLGRYTHADAGQMHLYLNYAREHWMQPGENPPVGVILCSGKSEALVHYTTDTLPTKLLVREYLTALPDEKLLAAELEKARKQLEKRK
jgi:predicted nuclease of restriction endonuclease-like (RecB) superfamily